MTNLGFVSVDELKNYGIDDLEQLLGVMTVSRLCFEHYIKYTPKPCEDNILPFIQTPDD